jgi:hypothetical protein
MNYVLIMVLGWIYPAPGGFAVIQQEFTSKQKCEAAQAALATPNSLAPAFVVLTQTCAPK